jgi:hypothetical protein
MGLILDSTVAITAERQGWTVHDLIGRIDLQAVMAV